MFFRLVYLDCVILRVKAKSVDYVNIVHSSRIEVS